MTYEYVWMAKADIYELHGGGNTEAESVLDASRRAGDEAFKQYKKTYNHAPEILSITITKKNKR